MTISATTDGRSLNILLVEDDDGDARAVQRAFQKAKIANLIVRAVDGVEALEILRGSNGKNKLPSPNLLLVDINMPRMNGVELCERIVANRPDVPVIVITAFGSLETAVSAIRAGAYDFITKPLEIDALIVALERAISTLLAPDGTMKNAEQLAAVFEAAGVDVAKPVVATCGSGMTASIIALALPVHLGLAAGVWRLGKSINAFT